ncbi:MFS transporter [Psychromonas sp. psych-6C06]|uniref:organoarsenical effux MFS transporter ArsJ n=1 Tax=Psychromonas sp. psych-6C06 TaxID=2058089 RepID=UPI000C3377F6|nr:organoarsenical effux MFS transporter ArsJ [Psychromonas sp. psych-6C06]PKF61398.1 MFS transporter [Psychromonas sp. psych-6C06]
MFKNLSDELKQYLVITGNYWAFTLTDGALRMLVVLYFHQLGYDALQVAFLFLFYEFFGVVTNLFGGWLGTRLGLNRTMNIGLLMQVVALAMLALPNGYLTIAWVMLAQALSGIAKDLNKMSAKSAIKLFVKDDQQGQLYKWVAILTGSKNTLKGIGFFLGGLLLTLIGFQSAMILMASVLMLVFIASLLLLKADLGKIERKVKFKELFSKSEAINRLSLARMFLFASRDVWFVVALPVYLSETYGWNSWTVGGLIALWVIVYGGIQSIAPYFTGKRSGKLPDGRSATLWAFALIFTPLLVMFSLSFANWLVVLCLFIFGALFAINSSLHSYLIVSYAQREGVSLDIGFYYMANAMGRLIGTLLSGWVFVNYGLSACLIVSSSLIVLAMLFSLKLPQEQFK